MSDRLLLAALAIGLLVPFSRCQNVTDNLDDGERAVAEDLGLCVEAIQCLDDGNFFERFDSVQERFQTKIESLGRLGPGELVTLEPDFVNGICDILGDMHTQCVMRHCPPAEASLYKTLAAGYDFLCNKHRGATNEALPCVMKVAQQAAAREGLMSKCERRNKCTDPSVIRGRWTRFLKAQHEPVTMDEMFNVTVCDNPMVRTICEYGSCMLSCFEDLCEEACGSQTHVQVVRDVLQVMVDHVRASTSHIDGCSAVPNTCLRQKGAETGGVVIFKVVVFIGAVLLASAIVFLFLWMRKRKSTGRCNCEINVFGVSVLENESDTE